MLKLFVATPMYGGRATAHFVHSMLRLQRLCGDLNVDFTYEFLTTESLITRGRNCLAQLFMDSHCSHMMFIDADIGFEPSDVVKLMACDQDLVCGLYPMKYIDWDNISQKVRMGLDSQSLANDTSPAICNVLETPDQRDNLVEVMEAGTGFMCIKRVVFETMMPHVPTYQGNRPGELNTIFHEFFATSIDPHSNTLRSEDYHFCHRWRELGGKVYAMTDINLQHIGDYVYSNTTKYVMPNPIDR